MQNTLYVLLDKHSHKTLYPRLTYLTSLLLPKCNPRRGEPVEDRKTMARNCLPHTCEPETSLIAAQNHVAQSLEHDAKRILPTSPVPAKKQQLSIVTVRHGGRKGLFGRRHTTQWKYDKLKYLVKNSLRECAPLPIRGDRMWTHPTRRTTNAVLARKVCVTNSFGGTARRAPLLAAMKL